LLLFFSIRAAMATMLVTDLRCEYRTNPLGIDDPQPRLSWKLESDLRGDAQEAYQILAASTPALLASNTGDLWDSGQLFTNAQNQIRYGGVILTNHQQVFWKVRAWDASANISAWSTNANWTMGVLNPAGWQGQWISFGSADVGSTLLRHNFSISTGLKRALINISGLGEYELSLNGTKVGSNFMSPGWTKYDKTVLYDTFDITSLLITGTNAVGIMLGNGMYNVPSSSRYDKFTGSFGPRKAIAQIRLEYNDGSATVIGTDANWKATNGPIIFNTIYGGEDYDARKEIPGWNVAGTDDSNWPAVTVTTGPGGILRGICFSSPPVTTQQVFTAVSSWPLATGITVYDFGQNAAEIPSITVHGPAGSTVTLTPSELINGDHTLNQIVSPTYMTYTLKGSGSETFTPRFYYFGYRYLQVNLRDSSGGTGGTLPTLDSIVSTTVSSSSEDTGTFSCSKALFNDIRRIVLWAQRNNSMSIFTDCPTRERLGWLEQDYLNGPGLRYERNLDALFKMMENNMADSQRPNGMVPDIAPEYTVFGGGFTDSPEWGSAVVQIPWQQYEFANDTGLIGQYYMPMKQYADYLTSQANGGIVNYGLGDWFDLGPNTLGQAQLTPVALTGTATYYLDVVALSRMAALLGNTNDASNYGMLATNIALAFNSQFYDARGFYSTDSDTADSMPLAVGLVNSTNVTKVANRLVQNIRNRGNTWTSGDIGFRYLLRALADNGRSDVVFDMLNRSNAPGYGFILSQGATSLTEGWDGSSSQDHFMLGQAVEWFYHDLAGIQPDTAGAGFRKIIIKPSVVGDVTQAGASYNSILGVVSNQWIYTNNQMTMNVSVPVGATATIYLPTFGTSASNLVVQESGLTIFQNGVAIEANGVVFAGTEDSAQQTYLLWDVASGNYTFTWGVFPPPAGLVASAGNGRVFLTWNAVAGASSYKLKRASNTGGPYSAIASGIPDTNYTDTAVANEVPYYYVVTTVGTNGESANSSEATATPAWILNLGFETPNVGTYQYNPLGASWTFTGSGDSGAGITANNSGFTSFNSPAPQGVQAGFVQSQGSLSQTLLGFIPGATYQITFAAAERAGPYQNGREAWNVQIDGNAIASFNPPADATNYVDYSTNFIASEPSHTLGFVGMDMGAGGNTVFIDNVRIQLQSLTPPQIYSQINSNQLQLSWPHKFIGWHLQAQTNSLETGLGTNWVDVSGSSSNELMAMPIVPTNKSVFFRMVYP